MQPHIGLGLQDRAHLIDHFKKGIGQIVGQVLFVFTHARKRDQLTKTRCDPLIAIANHGIIDRVAMHPETFQYLFAEFPLHSMGQGIFPVRQQVLINTAKGSSGTGIIFVTHDEHMI